MIRLDSTGRKLQALLGGGISTTALPIVVCYSDKTVSTYNGGVKLTTVSSATAVDICDAPASGIIRDIDFISARQSDISTQALTIRYNDATTTYPLAIETMNTGDQLSCTHASPFRVLDINGNIKQIASGNFGAITATSLTLNGGAALSTYAVSGTSGWTPSDTSGASLALTINAAAYIKIGQLVWALFDVTYPATASGLGAQIGGLPFTSATIGSNAMPVIVSFDNSGLAGQGRVLQTSTNFQFIVAASGNQTTNAQLSGKTVRGAALYESAS